MDKKIPNLVSWNLPRLKTCLLEIIKNSEEATSEAFYREFVDLATDISNLCDCPIIIEPCLYLVRGLFADVDVICAKALLSLGVLRYVDSLVFLHRSKNFDMHEMQYICDIHKLPSCVVELRHQIVHKSLPSIDQLKCEAWVVLNHAYNDYFKEILELPARDNLTMVSFSSNKSLQSDLLQMLLVQESLNNDMFPYIYNLVYNCAKYTMIANEINELEHLVLQTDCEYLCQLIEQTVEDAVDSGLNALSLESDAQIELIHSIFCHERKFFQIILNSRKNNCHRHIVVYFILKFAVSSNQSLFFKLVKKVLCSVNHISAGHAANVKVQTTLSWIHHVLNGERFFYNTNDKKFLHDCKIFVARIASELFLLLENEKFANVKNCILDILKIKFKRLI